MRFFNLFSKPTGSSEDVLKKVYDLVKSKDYQQYFIYDTDKNQATINKLFKACSGLNYDFNSNTHLLGKVAKNGTISATIDGSIWYEIGSLGKTIYIMPKDVLILVTNPDKQGAYTKSGYNFYAKLY